MQISCIEFLADMQKRGIIASFWNTPLVLVFCCQGLCLDFGVYSFMSALPYHKSIHFYSSAEGEKWMGFLTCIVEIPFYSWLCQIVFWLLFILNTTVHWLFCNKTMRTWASDGKHTEHLYQRFMAICENCVFFFWGVGEQSLYFERTFLLNHNCLHCRLLRKVCLAGNTVYYFFCFFNLP